MRDQQLSSSFWLHEFPCWELATSEDVERLKETCARVLQPVRNRFGKVVPTSWKWWSSGCTPRTGSHSAGGTVDFITPDADLWEVFEWGATYLLPSGYIGRWIYEPQTPQQGEHIHMAPRRDQLEVFGRGDIQALQELPNGNQYAYAFYDTTEGTFLDPYTLDPLVVRATAGWSSWWGVLALLGLFTLDLAGQSAGGIKLRSS